MTTPSQAPLSVPLTIATKFWPSAPSYPSYRSSITHLFSLLQHGVDESASICTFVKDFIAAQRDFLLALEETGSATNGTGSRDRPKEIFKGSRTSSFSSQSSSSSSSSSFPTASPGSSLVKALQSHTVAPLLTSHAQTVQSLEKKILLPFGEWSAEHVERIRRHWDLIEEWLDAFEEGQDELDKLRSNYENKCRQADEAEDDARFSGLDVTEYISSASSPSQSTSLTSTASPEQDKALGASFTEGLESTETDATLVTSEAAGTDDLDPVKLERRQTLRKQFGFTPRSASGGEPKPSAPHDQIERSPTAKKTGPKTITSALNSALSAPALQGIRDRLAAAAGTAGGIAEKYKRLRLEADRIEGEYLTKARKLDNLRCRMEDAISDAFVVLQRLEFDRLVAVKSVLREYSQAVRPLNPASVETLGPVLKNYDPNALLSRMIATASTGLYRPQVEVFHPFYHDEDEMEVGNNPSPSVAEGTGWAGFGMSLEARWRSEILHRQASIMDAISSSGVTTPSKTAVALPLVFSHLLSSLEQSYSKDSLWPTPKSPSDAQTPLNISKRKVWLYDVSLRSAHACRDAIISHIVSSAHPGAELGAGLQAVLDRFDPPTKVMTLKIWLAELAPGLVPNGSTEGEVADAVAGGGLIPEENWYLIESLYKAAESVEYRWRKEKLAKGKGKEGNENGEGNGEANTRSSIKVELDDDIKAEIRRGVVEDLTVVLGKLSLIHLTVLDSLIVHLKSLISSTPTSHESDSTYINKIALALGPFVLRPAKTTPMALLSPIPTLVLMDLIISYDELLPPALIRKREREASKTPKVVGSKGLPTPTRKRTKPIDRRIRRSQLLSEGGTAFIAGRTIASLADRGGELPPAPPLPKSAPKILTDSTALQEQRSGTEEEEEEETPTPIAQRLFGALKVSSSSKSISGAATNESGGTSDVPPASSSSSILSVNNNNSSNTLSVSPINENPPKPGSSNGGSDYGTPTEEVNEKKFDVGKSPLVTSEDGGALAPAPALLELQGGSGDVGRDGKESLSDEKTGGGEVGGGGGIVRTTSTSSTASSAQDPTHVNLDRSRGEDDPAEKVVVIGGGGGGGSGSGRSSVSSMSGPSLAGTTTTSSSSSNVARLSRQFGSSSSASASGVGASASGGAGGGVGASGATRAPSRSGAIRGPRVATGPRAMGSSIGGGGAGGGVGAGGAGGTGGT